MDRVLIVQQVPHEGPGLIGQLLREHGLEPVIMRAWRGDVASVPDIGRGAWRALVVLGGPMGVYEETAYPFITEEIKLIENALRAGVPTLGICLGAQLIARAAGAAVYSGASKEIGWYKVRLTPEAAIDRLLVGLPEEFTVFQWHGDTFDVPPRSKLLATSELFPNQLIRVGHNVYGVQFHLEVTEEMVRDWLIVNRDELASLGPVIDPEKIIAQTPLFIPSLHRHGRSVVSRFLRLSAAGCL